MREKENRKNEREAHKRGGVGEIEREGGRWREREKPKEKTAKRLKKEKKNRAVKMPPVKGQVEGSIQMRR